MLNYLEKFNNLPQELREKISDPIIMENISKIEKEYGLTLAMIVMRIMVKDISIVDLAKYFVFEHEMDGRKAEKLVDDLKNRVFFEMADYLGFGVAKNEDQSEVNKKEPSDNWMEMKKREAAARGSSFFFSSEDEEEIQELTKKVEGFASGEKIETPEEVGARIDNKISEIRKQLGIGFSSEDLSFRFNQILKTYLKGIRNKVDTRQTFIKEVGSGGLGMESIFVDNILLLADSEGFENSIKSESVSGNSSNNTISSDDKLDNEASKDSQMKNAENKKDNNFALGLSGARDIDYDFSKMPKVAGKGAVDRRKIVEDEIGSAQKDIPKVSVFDSSDRKEKEFKIEKNNADNKDDSMKAGAGFEGAKIKNSMPNVISLKNDKVVEGRKKVVDVKHVPKLVGPIDELGEMTLLNFRRLSSDPKEASLKIIEKIKFLEEDNYAQRLAGIKSWRKSPLNSLYLQIGKESINSNKTVSQTVEEMIGSGKECLTESEFKAIMDLNRKIRF